MDLLFLGSQIISLDQPLDANQERETIIPSLQLNRTISFRPTYDNFLLQNSRELIIIRWKSSDRAVVLYRSRYLKSDIPFSFLFRELDNGKNYRNPTTKMFNNCVYLVHFEQIMSAVYNKIWQTEKKLPPEGLFDKSEIQLSQVNSIFSSSSY